MMNKPPGQRRRSLLRFKKSDSGATAVEFAMVGGPFLFLLGVLFETAFMLFSEYVIENGVTEASRLIRTGQGKNMNAITFKNEVCGKMATFLRCQEELKVDVRKFKTFQAVNLPNPVQNGELSPALKKDNFQKSGPMEVVVVRTYYEWKLFMPGLSMLSDLNGGKRLLTAGAAFRNEPFPP